MMIDKPTYIKVYITHASSMAGTQETTGSTQSRTRKKQKVKRTDYYGDEDTQRNPDDDVGVHDIKQAD